MNGKRKIEKRSYRGKRANPKAKANNWLFVFQVSKNAKEISEKVESDSIHPKFLTVGCIHSCTLRITWPNFPYLTWNELFGHWAVLKTIFCSVSSLDKPELAFKLSIDVKKWLASHMKANSRMVLHHNLATASINHHWCPILITLQGSLENNVMLFKPFSSGFQREFC